MTYITVSLSTLSYSSEFLILLLRNELVIRFEFLILILRNELVLACTTLIASKFQRT